MCSRKTDPLYTLNKDNLFQMVTSLNGPDNYLTGETVGAPTLSFSPGTVQQLMLLPGAGTRSYFRSHEGDTISQFQDPIFEAMRETQYLSFLDQKIKGS